MRPDGGMIQHGVELENWTLVQYSIALWCNSKTPEGLLPELAKDRRPRRGETGSQRKILQRSITRSSESFCPYTSALAGRKYEQARPENQLSSSPSDEPGGL